MNQESNHNCVDTTDLLETTKVNIEKYGLQVITVNSTSYTPSFAYSIGLWQKFKHLEIICFGLPNDLGHAIINDAAEIIKSGEKISAGKTYFNIFKEVARLNF